MHSPIPNIFLIVVVLVAESERAPLTYIMTLDTCISTGTLRSLNAVVIKHPNVRAAITLREKAKSEFALDNTVFIIPSGSDYSK